MSEVMILAVCFQLKQLKKQPEKKFRLERGLEPMTLRYRCNALSTELSSLIAQWIEHCTGIARSWVRVPFKPEFFFRLLFQLLKLKAHCEDHNFTQYKECMAHLQEHRLSHLIFSLRHPYGIEMSIIFFFIHMYTMANAE